MTKHPFRLLSGKPTVSVVEKEQIFKNVEAHLRRERVREQPYLTRKLVRLAFGTVVLLGLIFGGSYIFLSRHNDEFRIKGGGQFADIEIHCIGAAKDDVCRQGTKLIFRVSASPKKPYLAAYGRRKLGPTINSDGEPPLIWYFPETKNASSVDVSDLDETGILKQGILIGAEHQAGTYELVAVFSEKPLVREEIRSIQDPASSLKQTVIILEKDFVIEETP